MSRRTRPFVARAAHKGEEVQGAFRGLIFPFPDQIEAVHLSAKRIMGERNGAAGIVGINSFNFKQNRVRYFLRFCAPGDMVIK